MSQQQRVLEYLKTNKTINPIQSLTELSVYRLSDVILKLRQQGHDITTHRIKHVNKYGESTSFGEYEYSE